MKQSQKIAKIIALKLFIQIFNFPDQICSKVATFYSQLATIYINNKKKLDKTCT